MSNYVVDVHFDKMCLSLSVSLSIESIWPIIKKLLLYSTNPHSRCLQWNNDWPTMLLHRLVLCY